MAQASRWPDARVDALRSLLAAAKSSASMIARELSREFGVKVSRNAVIGKTSRLGLQLPQLPDDVTHGARGSYRRQRPRPTRREVAMPMPAAPPSAPPPAAVCCTFLELDSTRCHWPIGDPHEPGLMFCGQPVERNGYCATHCGKAFQKSKASTSTIAWRLGRGRWK